MPDITEQSRINLNNILRDERKAKLVPLEANFYENAAKHIRELEEEKNRIEDTYSTKYAIIDDEIKTARKSIENIIERRIGKIIKEASLRASSKQKEKQDIDSLTKEERRFYESLLGLMTEWRGEILDKIFKKEKLQPCFHEDLPANNVKKEAIFEDKKDISKEYIVVRLLRDIPTFVGVDGRNYTLSKEDIAVLSTVNAKALINRKAAIQIAIKR